MDLEELMNEIDTYIEAINVGEDREHLWEGYQEITAMRMRMQEIHNQIAYLEVQGKATAAMKKFRTMIVANTIEALDKAAAFESRKISAKTIEFQMGREG